MTHASQSGSRNRQRKPSFPALNKSLVIAVKHDRAAMNEGRPGRRRQETFSGEWQLTWLQLARSVASRFNSQIDAPWSLDVVQDALEKGTHALPRDMYERELFLRALQSAMNGFYDISVEWRREMKLPIPAAPQDYVQLALGADPQLSSYDPFGFDPESIGFFKILDWNVKRQLLPENVGEVERSPAHRQDWIVPAAAFTPYERREQATLGAPCPSLVDYVEDTREEGNDKLILRVTKSRYWRVAAIRYFMRDHRDAYDSVVQRIELDGLRNVLAGSPRSNICVNVTLMSREGTVLAIKRSRGVRLWASYYQLGAHETMLHAQPGQAYETCYELAVRALREELNLTDIEDYYNRIVFSWFGYYLPDASAYFFAHVRSRLTEAELTETIPQAESAFEVGNLEWVPLTHDFVRNVVEQWSVGPWDPVENSNGRNFLPHSCLSATQLWRVHRLGLLPAHP